ncbi:hypothetical protein CBER1_08133 [Cercospora berteroae]|uniref:Uncharacterized protein n=1 Tax=Cercospora berteroae TaxID=357750 RepID=A0A2S6CLG5_9PEZI|nr:hypothetical protein CBER1_08133 [Cercospora berteroae]
MELLECDFDTAKPSFINLDQGYWIEWRNLSRFRSSGNQSRLSPTSFHRATWAYHKAERHRATERKTAQKNVWCRSALHQVPHAQYNRHAGPRSSGKQNHIASLQNWRHSTPLNVAATEIQHVAETWKSSRQQDPRRLSPSGPSKPLSVHTMNSKPANVNQSCLKACYHSAFRAWTTAPHLHTASETAECFEWRQTAGPAQIFALDQRHHIFGHSSRRPKTATGDRDLGHDQAMGVHLTVVPRWNLRGSV